MDDAHGLEEMLLVIASGSAPMRQSDAMNSGSRPNPRAMFFHEVAKCPVSNISTFSPGDNVLTSAASNAPVPELVWMMTGDWVLNTDFTPSSTVWPSR
jgi:hypothetical protein